jgi:hypothetical protein
MKYYGWKKIQFGKQINIRYLVEVKAKLINHPRVKVIERFAPTSKFCPVGVIIRKMILNFQIESINVASVAMKKIEIFTLQII